MTFPVPRASVHSAAALALDLGALRRPMVTDLQRRPQSGWAKMSKLKKKAWLEEWKLLKMQVEGDCYEVYARTKEGQSIEAFFHPVTLKKLVVFRRGRRSTGGRLHRLTPNWLRAGYRLITAGLADSGKARDRPLSWGDLRTPMMAPLETHQPAPRDAPVGQVTQQEGCGAEQPIEHRGGARPPTSRPSISSETAMSSSRSHSVRSTQAPSSRPALLPWSDTVTQGPSTLIAA